MSREQLQQLYTDNLRKEHQAGMQEGARMVQAEPLPPREPAAMPIEPSANITPGLLALGVRNVINPQWDFKNIMKHRQ